MLKKKKILIREFVILVYTNGEIFMDGFDKFLLWKLNQKPKEGFLPYVRKLHGFQNEMENR